ncbi:hypothetical protein PX554_20035 [Sphingomonas sp. H39-1-10]|uniref:hypothetical protein n=1 Tax=Sphingomonas pollutisoli TaxID=3030829 RepID=UPI0023BA010D|nr:hypothetical protein [Sphingomonas pollutisoli]MDF0490423.1 hypothetical protein [Sphingomonas pollutisoli]
MRLTDHIAARRHLYRHPRPFAPLLMVIDIPRTLAGDGLALGRYYPVIVENEQELGEFEDFLSADRDRPVPPNLLDHRPSSIEVPGVTFFEFAPSEPGWPWLLLCQWPAQLAGQLDSDPDLLARGAYTTETFASRRELLAGVTLLLGMIDKTHPAHVFLRVCPMAAQA